MFLCFLDKQTEDRPGSPAAASKVELSSQETPRQEVERPIEGLTVVAREILGCHYILAVSNFYTRVLVLICRVLCLYCSFVTGSS
jgi:hypothetical protein